MSELQLVVSDLMFGASHSEIMYLVVNAYSSNAAM